MSKEKEKVRRLQAILCLVFGHDDKSFEVEGKWKSMGDRPPGQWFHQSVQCLRCRRWLITGAILKNAAGEPY